MKSFGKKFFHKLFWGFVSFNLCINHSLSNSIHQTIIKKILFSFFAVLTARSFSLNQMKINPLSKTLLDGVLRKKTQLFLFERICCSQHPASGNGSFSVTTQLLTQCPITRSFHVWYSDKSIHNAKQTKFY